MQFQKLQRLLERADKKGRVGDEPQPFHRLMFRGTHQYNQSHINKIKAATSKSSTTISSQFDSFVRDRKIYTTASRRETPDSPEKLLSKQNIKRSCIEHHLASHHLAGNKSDFKNYDNFPFKNQPCLPKTQPSSKASNAAYFSQIHTKPGSELEYQESVSTLETFGKLDKYKKKPQVPKLPKKIDVGDFEFMKRVGAGKFSQVHMVRERATSFIAALKIIKKEQINSSKMLNQFVREVKIHSHLKHPNIVSLYSTFSDDRNVYLLEEYGNGGQLYKRLKDVATFNEKTVSFIIRSVLEAVKYLHSKDIIHRDIKPENIVLVHGSVKLCDFGWSVFEPSTLRETVCGTPLYTCPELVKGQKYSDKIDMWTIGMLTFELFFGQIPFKIEDEEDLAKIATDEISFPNNIRYTVEMEDFVSQLLKKNPRERLTAEIMLLHPFIQKYASVEVCEELCF